MELTYTLVDLGLPDEITGQSGFDPEAWEARARGINDLGQAVGFIKNLNTGKTDAFLWLPSEAYGVDPGMHLLTPESPNQNRSTVASDINNFGVIAGKISHSSDGSNGFVWELLPEDVDADGDPDFVEHELPNVTFEARAVSDAPPPEYQVVGLTRDPDNTSDLRGFVWEPAIGLLGLVTTLEPAQGDPMEWETSDAWDINTGRIVAGDSTNPATGPNCDTPSSDATAWAVPVVAGGLVGIPLPQPSSFHANNTTDEADGGARGVNDQSMLVGWGLEPSGRLCLTQALLFLMPSDLSDVVNLGDAGDLTNIDQTIAERINDPTPGSFLPMQIVGHHLTIREPIVWTQDQNSTNGWDTDLLNDVTRWRDCEDDAFWLQPNQFSTPADQEVDLNDDGYIVGWGVREVDPPSSVCLIRAYLLIPVECRADVNHDGVVDVDDLTFVLLNWAPSGCYAEEPDCVSRTPVSCCADVNLDGFVDQDDMTDVLADWFCGYPGGQDAEPAYEIVEIVNAFLEGEITLEEAVEQLQAITED